MNNWLLPSYGLRWPDCLCFITLTACGCSPSDSRELTLDALIVSNPVKHVKASSSSSSMLDGGTLVATIVAVLEDGCIIVTVMRF